MPLEQAHKARNMVRYDYGLDWMAKFVRFVSTCDLRKGAIVSTLPRQ